MNFLSLAKKRCSIRAYQDRPVEPEKLDAVLQAGRVAPTGVNYQPQRLLVVQSPEGLSKIAEATNVYGAPVVILVCAEQNAAWTRKYDDHNIYEIDAAIVTDHMMLAATEQGLGSLWICRFKPEVLRAAFQIPASHIPVNLLCLGYAQPEAVLSPDRHDKLRKPLSDTVWYESF